MPTTTPRRSPSARHPSKASNLMVRLDAAGKRSIANAAKIRRMSVSHYVRAVTVAQAEQEVEAAQHSTIFLSPAEQLAFWNALHEPVVLTPAQKKLAKIARGEA